MNRCARKPSWTSINRDRNNVHYVFVPEGASVGVEYLAGEAFDLHDASASPAPSNGDIVLGLRRSASPTNSRRRRHLADAGQATLGTSTGLTNDYEYILLESPILNEAGQPEVKARGCNYSTWRSRDIGKSGEVGSDAAVLGKNPLWRLSIELNSEAPYNQDNFGGLEGLGVPRQLLTNRGAASGYYDSHNSIGGSTTSSCTRSDNQRSDAPRGRDVARPGPWYTTANGGFDGRWVQLFDDQKGL